MPYFSKLRFTENKPVLLRLRLVLFITYLPNWIQNKLNLQHKIDIPPTKEDAKKNPTNNI